MYTLIVPTRRRHTGCKLVARETKRYIAIFLVGKKEGSSKRLVKVELEVKVKS